MGNAHNLKHARPAERGAAFSASNRPFDLNGETKRARQSQNRAIIAAEVGRFECAHPACSYRRRLDSPTTRRTRPMSASDDDAVLDGPITA